MEKYSLNSFIKKILKVEYLKQYSLEKMTSTSSDPGANTSSTTATSSPTPSASGASSSPASTPAPDLFGVIGGMLKEFAATLNNDTNENIDIVTRDVKNLYSQFGSMVYQNSNMLQMSAEEVRKKTVEDLYKQVKFGVLTCRNNCRWVLTTTCQSMKILDELQKKLTEEGFTVTYVIRANDSVVTVTW